MWKKLNFSLLEKNVTCNKKQQRKERRHRERRDASDTNGLQVTPSDTNGPLSQLHGLGYRGHTRAPNVGQNCFAPEIIHILSYNVLKEDNRQKLMSSTFFCIPTSHTTQCIDITY